MLKLRKHLKLIAKRFAQKERIDYTETFSPMSKIDFLRIILVLIAHFDSKLQQIM